MDDKRVHRLCACRAWHMQSVENALMRSVQPACFIDVKVLTCRQSACVSKHRCQTSSESTHLLERAAAAPSQHEIRARAEQARQCRTRSWRRHDFERLRPLKYADARRASCSTDDWSMPLPSSSFLMDSGTRRDTPFTRECFFWYGDFHNALAHVTSLHPHRHHALHPRQTVAKGGQGPL